MRGVQVHKPHLLSRLDACLLTALASVLPVSQMPTADAPEVDVTLADEASAIISEEEPNKVLPSSPALENVSALVGDEEGAEASADQSDSGRLTAEEREAIPEDEVVHGVKLRNVRFRRDLEILRKPIKDLTEEEVERRIYLACLDQTSKQQAWVTKFIRGNFRSRLLDIDPASERREKEHALQLALNFIKSIRTTVPLFRKREEHTLAKAIALRRRRAVMGKAIEQDIDAYRRARSHLLGVQEAEKEMLTKEMIARRDAYINSLGPIGYFWYALVKGFLVPKFAPNRNEYDED
eukprot:Blabericola_migrator_1__9128@NODE_4880_length_947_cov_30_314773_g3054_i0_p1_GENE_NODE_4880_length_947_cov_30_314773_g3054_i0NODE_4880_length_947_cov_30_314773_g3054_i0_p1_ORF_typecomplete_len294_score54_21_NODE_4880_length_947_cov_30_314773_g3054_i04885